MVPESLSAKKALPWRLRDGTRAQVDDSFRERMWRNRPGSALSDDIKDGVGRADGFDVLGKAGTAIVTNGSNIHAGTVRQSDRPRRSIILWWTHGPQTRPPMQPPPIGRNSVVHGPKRALPPRLMENEEWNWLWRDEPLSAEEQWRCLGVKCGQEEGAARL